MTRNWSDILEFKNFIWITWHVYVSMQTFYATKEMWKDEYPYFMLFCSMSWKVSSSWIHFHLNGIERSSNAGLNYNFMLFHKAGPNNLECIIFLWNDLECRECWFAASDNKPIKGKLTRILVVTSWLRQRQLPAVTTSRTPQCWFLMPA